MGRYSTAAAVSVLALLAGGIVPVAMAAPAGAEPAVEATPGSAPPPSTSTPASVPSAPPSGVQRASDPDVIAVAGEPVTEVVVLGGIGSAQVSWTAPSGDSVPVRYEVVAKPSGVSCETTTTSCRLVGLPTNGTAVDVTVRAHYADGASEWTTVRVTGTRMTVALTVAVAKYARRISVSGNVRLSDNQPLAAAPVTVEQLPNGAKAWQPLASVTSNGTGAYAHTFTALRTMHVRAVVAGSTNRLGAVAGTKLTVFSAATMVANDTTIKLADRAHFTGGVWPARPGGVVYLQQWTSGGWRTVQSSVLTANSRFSVGRTVMTGGTTQWRIQIPANQQVIVATAPVVKVAVAVVPNVRITTVTRSQVPYSWRPGCPVHYSRLRAVAINHIDFAGQYRRGTIVVERRYASQVAAAFSAGFYQRFPIRSMVPIDQYYNKGKRSGVQADIASMSAGNTAAFNCRGVVGHPKRMSAHSLGNALDINPRENPYVTGGTVYPKGSSSYLNRANKRPGMLFASTSIIKKLRSYGWVWLASIRDYQHISRHGG